MTTETDTRQNYRIVIDQEGDARTVEYLEGRTLTELAGYFLDFVDRHAVVESVTVVGPMPGWEVIAIEHGGNDTEFTERVAAWTVQGAIGMFRRTYSAPDWDILKVEQL